MAFVFEEMAFGLMLSAARRGFAPNHLTFRLARQFFRQVRFIVNQRVNPDSFADVGAAAR